MFVFLSRLHKFIGKILSMIQRITPRGEIGSVSFFRQNPPEQFVVRNKSPAGIGKPPLIIAHAYIPSWNQRS